MVFPVTNKLTVKPLPPSIINLPNPNPSVGTVDKLNPARQCTSEVLCNAPKVGTFELERIKLFEPPPEAAEISIVPVIAPADDMVNVVAAADASPKTILEPVPETVQAASVVALFKILYVIPAVVKSAGFEPDPLAKLVQLVVDDNEPD